MRKNLVISVGIFLSLAASRFIPHPPNFTSLIALSFYVPLFFGRKYIFAVVISFIITDLIIGYHNITHWTWGSILIIGFLTKYIPNKLLARISGAMGGAVIFYLLTNLGVWSTGMYGYHLKGLVECYILAIPFFGYSIVSTLIFSSLIEIFYKLYKTKLVKQ